MKTAEEILDQYIINRFDRVDRDTFVKAMHGYGEMLLREAAERAKVDATYLNGTDSFPTDKFRLDDNDGYIEHIKCNKQSILSIIDEMK